MIFQLLDTVLHKMTFVGFYFSFHQWCFSFTLWWRNLCSSFL